MIKRGGDNKGFIKRLLQKNSNKLEKTVHIICQTGEHFLHFFGV